MANGELPEGFFGWVLTGVGAAMATLVTAIGTLWRGIESRNARAIEEQAKQIVHVEAEVKMVRETLSTTEAARLECERDRASLSAKCEIFEKRLSRLEGQS
jgi:septal ring factor EnvC (AmiA/AmiB activator)